MRELWSLLNALTDEQRKLARDAGPLSHLPSHRSTRAEVFCILFDTCTLLCFVVLHFILFIVCCADRDNGEAVGRSAEAVRGRWRAAACSDHRVLGRRRIHAARGRVLDSRAGAAQTSRGEDAISFTLVLFSSVFVNGLV